MGWWQIGKSGENMGNRATGLLWGDQMADIMDSALARMSAVYKAAWGRAPEADEFRAGLEFSLGGRGD